MQNILLTLPLGSILIITLFQLLRRWLRASILLSAAVIVLMTAIVCGVWSAVEWPGLDVFAMHVAIYLLTIYISALLEKQRQVSSSNKSKWYWGPAALIGFFTLVVLINIVFVVLANIGTDSMIGRWLLPQPRSGEPAHSVFPGVVSHDFGEKEEQYNLYQENRDKQTQRGWQLHYGWQEVPIAGKSAKFLLEVVDKQNRPVEADQVHGIFYYPADSRLDQKFILQRDQPGHYSAMITLPHAGRWDLVLQIERGTDHHEVRASTDVLKANQS